MSGPSESDSSDQSGRESDSEGLAASSNESELSDTTRKRRHNTQIQGKAWIFRGKITTNLLHNDSDPASIDVDADDEEAKIQKTKSQTEAALRRSLPQAPSSSTNFLRAYGPCLQS
jgi:hypothetical protein